jgi:hypothetical protein
VMAIERTGWRLVTPNTELEVALDAGEIAAGGAIRESGSERAASGRSKSHRPEAEILKDAVASFAQLKKTPAFWD